MRRTCTRVRSARTSRTSCAGCGGSRRSTVPPPLSSAARRRSAIHASSTSSSPAYALRLCSAAMDHPTGDVDSSSGTLLFGQSPQCSPREKACLNERRPPMMVTGRAAAAGLSPHRRAGVAMRRAVSRRTWKPLCSLPSSYGLDSRASASVRCVRSANSSSTMRGRTSVRLALPTPERILRQQETAIRTRRGGPRTLRERSQSVPSYRAPSRHRTQSERSPSASRRIGAGSTPPIAVGSSASSTRAGKSHTHVLPCFARPICHTPCFPHA